MQCSSCGTENRPDVRFCRKCGQPLIAASFGEIPQSGGRPAVIVCPVCGATAKAGGRFCPRCGGPLDSSVKATPSTQPATGPVPGPSATSTVAPDELPVVPDYGLMPVPAPITGAPRTLWILLGGVLLLACVVLMLVTMITWLRQGKLPFIGDNDPRHTTVLTATPDLDTPTLTPSSTITPPALPPVSAPTSTLAPPTVTLTATLPSPTPTLTLTATTPVTPVSEADARVELVASTQAVRIGESATFTVTLINTGEVALGRLRYSLEGPWDDLLVASETVGPLVIEQPGPLEPGAEQVVVFRLEGKRIGVTRLWAGVTFAVEWATPRLDRRTSTEITVGITP